MGRSISPLDRSTSIIRTARLQERSMWLSGRSVSSSGARMDERYSSLPGHHFTRRRLSATSHKNIRLRPVRPSPRITDADVRLQTGRLRGGHRLRPFAAQAQYQFPPNAVKKIITNPSPISPNAANSLHTTLYHCFPTTDQLSWIANQNAATAVAPNRITETSRWEMRRLVKPSTVPAQPASSVSASPQ